MIYISAREAKTPKDKIIGLIGKEKPLSLLLNTRFGIHTFGLKFAIDVLILNSKNEVVSIKQGLKPNRIFMWNPIYKKVLELPHGTISKKRVGKSSIINLKIV